jgi:RNA polymerase sigma factor (sigma-70 family)
MEAHSLPRHGGGLALVRSRKLLAAASDARLVEQLRRGNDVAFEVLYDRHHRAVLSYCRHILGSLDEAEDALQQAFVSAHGDIVATDKPIRFKAWLYTIARNRCLSMLRARRERPSDGLEPVSLVGLADEVQHRADLKELLEDMRELPEDQRTALVLSELGDLSHVEVAEVVGCEPLKVKSLVFQARSRLLESRQARETPCAEIREQLSTLRGGALRRGPLRRHVKGCPGCAEFRADVKRQRQMLAAVLPVIPTIGLRDSALAAAGTGATAAAGGSAAAVGGAGVAAVAKAGALKVALIAVAAGGAAVGGGVAAERALHGELGSRPAAVQPENAAGADDEGGDAAESRSLPGGVGDEQGDGARSGEARAPDGRGRSGEAREPDGRGRSEEALAERGAHGKGKGGGDGEVNGNGKAKGNGYGKGKGNANGNGRGGHGHGRARSKSRGAEARERAATRGNGQHRGQAKTRPGLTRTKPTPRHTPAKAPPAKGEGRSNGDDGALPTIPHGQPKAPTASPRPHAPRTKTPPADAIAHRPAS